MMQKTTRTNAVCQRIMILATITSVALQLSSCDFDTTIFGEFNNRNDPRTTEYADYSIEVLAGIGSGPIPDNGPASQLRLSTVTDLKAAGGFLYVADVMHNRVIRIDEATGAAETIAGTGAPGYSGDGGPAKQARLFAPTAVLVNDDGSVFILDAMNNAVRRIETDGRIGTYANLEALTGEKTDIGVQSDWPRVGRMASLGDKLLITHQDRLYSLKEDNGSMSANQYPSIEFNNELGAWIYSLATTNDGTVWLSIWNHEQQRRMLGRIANGSDEFDILKSFDYNALDSIEVDSSGRIFFCNTSEEIIAYDPSTGSITAMTDNIGGSIFCLNEAGKLYRFSGWTEAFGQHVIVRYDAPLASGVLVAGPLQTNSYSTRGDYIEVNGIALDEAKAALYFTEAWTSRISCVYPATKVVSPILENIGRGVSNVAVGPDGELVFCAWGGEGAYRIDTDGTFSLITPPITDQVHSVAIAPNGAVFAASSKWLNSGGYNYSTGLVARVAGENTIAKVGNGSPITYSDPNGAYSSSIPIGNVRAICFSPSGTLYLAEDQNRVLSVAPTGIVTRVTGGTWTDASAIDVWFDSFSEEDEFEKASESSIYGQVNGLAYGTDGSLYISHGYNTVLRVNAAGLLEKLRFELDGRTVDLCTSGVAVDSAGCLYLATRYQIIKATPRL